MSVVEKIKIGSTEYDVKDSISGYITSSALSPYRTSSAQDVIDETKVDKVSGKGLSTNDYDASEKQKVADAYSDKHTHSNKALLDTYTQTEANLADAVTKKHEHSNKSVIDGITSALINAWNTASTWITTNGANVLSHLADSVVHITSAERTAWNAKQNALVSGTNIKTVNNNSLLGSGNITISGGGEESYELIEKIIVGYSITTSEPTDGSWYDGSTVVEQDLNASDFTPVSGTFYKHTGTIPGIGWGNLTYTGFPARGIYYYDGTDYTSYWENTGTTKNPYYAILTTQKTWESGKYYKFVSGALFSTISRNTETDGTAYSFKKVLVAIRMQGQYTGRRDLSFAFGVLGNVFIGAYENWLISEKHPIRNFYEFDISSGCGVRVSWSKNTTPAAFYNDGYYMDNQDIPKQEIFYPESSTHLDIKDYYPNIPCKKVLIEVRDSSTQAILPTSEMEIWGVRY